jgi:hypothetical protein
MQFLPLGALRLDFQGLGMAPASRSDSGGSQMAETTGLVTSFTLVDSLVDSTEIMESLADF